MKLAMWGILVLSSIGLLYQMIVNRGKVGRILSRFGVQLLLGAFFLYAVNLTESFTHVSLPINATTLATVGLLGLPGLLLLGAVKLAIV